MKSPMRTLTTLPAHPDMNAPPRSPSPAGRWARARRAAAQLTRRAVHGDTHSFALIDAKAASGMLGVPYTWLLAQAREGRIPHHRLGHYVRFDPEDLKEWLQETRIDAPANGFRPR
jgi:excisionase family DNA binding protein